MASKELKSELKASTGFSQFYEAPCSRLELKVNCPKRLKAQKTRTGSSSKFGFDCKKKKIHHKLWRMNFLMKFIFAIICLFSKQMLSFIPFLKRKRKRKLERNWIVIKFWARARNRIADELLFRGLDLQTRFVTKIDSEMLIGVLDSSPGGEPVL